MNYKLINTYTLAIFVQKIGSYEEIEFLSSCTIIQLNTVILVSSHLAKIWKNTGKSALAKWELGTGKVQVENKTI